ncbi:MAG: ABC transporter, partial [Rhodobacteraceae bacterium]|nr:ABC transporter [Paracoccaceae bacterium]
MAKNDPRKGTEEREKSRRVGALGGLAPFLSPYRKLAALAVLALICTAALSLALPLAVRRVIDGFNAEIALMDAYFAAAVALAALLALGTAVRYYLVTRLGERVVADIRLAVYERVIGMSPAFFERIMTGEVLSRLTTDTTLILSVIGSSISVAMRMALTLLGGIVLMLVTSAKLTGLVLLLVPVTVLPIILLGRRLRVLSRESQDRVADSSGQASETLLAAQTVQAYTHERVSRQAFGALTESAFATALKRIRTR